MVYNVKKVSLSYVKRFSNYVKERKLGTDLEGLYDLFAYSLKVINRFPARESNYYIEKYGGDCINYLMKTKSVPKKPEKLGTSDRVGIITLSLSYFVAVGVSSGINNINKGDELTDGFKESL